MIIQNKEKLKGMKVSIGIPVHNGEKFMRKKLDSLIAQTFTNFEIIISDNGSTDLTSKICNEYTKKDKRIIYFQQKENIGGWNNFLFVLEKAKNEYFFWTAVDDIILPQFIEKNLETLQNEKIVCSANQVKYYGEKNYNLEQENTSRYSKIKNKIVKKFSPLQNVSTSGKLDKKIRKYLKIHGHHHIFYGIYRTKQLKKIIIPKDFSGIDLAVMINSLKFGDIQVNNDILMYRYDSGVSSNGFFNYKKSRNLSFFQALFHLIPFTKWFIKKFGKKEFLKNLDLFILLNLEGFFYLGVDVVRKIGGFKNK